MGAPPEVHTTEGALLLQLRDFLQRSLYDPDQGYFTAARANAPVGSVGKALAFPQLAGEDGYRKAVREAYDNLEVRTSSCDQSELQICKLRWIHQTCRYSYKSAWHSITDQQGLLSRPACAACRLPG